MNNENSKHLGNREIDERDIKGPLLKATIATASVLPKGLRTGDSSDYMARHIRTNARIDESMLSKDLRGSYDPKGNLVKEILLDKSAETGVMMMKKGALERHVLNGIAKSNVSSWDYRSEDIFKATEGAHTNCVLGGPATPDEIALAAYHIRNAALNGIEM